MSDRPVTVVPPAILFHYFRGPWKAADGDSLSWDPYCYCTGGGIRFIWARADVWVRVWAPLLKRIYWGGIFSLGKPAALAVLLYILVASI